MTTKPDEVTLNELTAIRLFVLQRAIGALIVTHPNPEKFAEAFRAATATAQVEHLFVPQAKDRFRQEAADFARELLQTAEDEVGRRQNRNIYEG